MVNRIRKHVIDLLAADSRLLQGGDAYNPGGGVITGGVSSTPAWSGVQRVERGGTATAGMVNLFETSYEKDATDHRPAIYCGSRAFGWSSRRDLQAISSAYIEYRIGILPLILVSHQPDKLTAQAEADQLTANVKLVIVGSHQVEGGYWYEITIPGESGGGNAREHTWVSATPNNGVAMALSAVPLVIRYSWNPSSPA